MPVHKLRISFTGAASNAKRAINILEALAQEHEDFEGSENEAYHAETCISAYGDTLLALAKGDIDIEELRDFWFHNQDIQAIPYDGKVLTFNREEEGNAE